MHLPLLLPDSASGRKAQQQQQHPPPPPLKSKPPPTPPIYAAGTPPPTTSAPPPMPAMPVPAVSGGASSRRAKAKAKPRHNPLAAIPVGGRLKRISNTESVYTLIKTSTGDKFACRLCSRSFNLRCTLLRHVRHQHQGRFVPHPCPQCGQIFKRTDHLKVHLKKIHNVETPTRASRMKAKKEQEEMLMAGGVNNEEDEIDATVVEMEEEEMIEEEEEEEVVANQTA